jgi:hypothetical protein
MLQLVICLPSPHSHVKLSCRVNEVRLAQRAKKGSQESKGLPDQEAPWAWKDQRGAQVLRVSPDLQENPD